MIQHGERRSTATALVSPIVRATLDHQFVPWSIYRKLVRFLCKLMPRLTFDKFIWREGCLKLRFVPESQPGVPSLRSAALEAPAEIEPPAGALYAQDRGEHRQAAGAVATTGLVFPSRPSVSYAAKRDFVARCSPTVSLE
jgi:hypothetical protein